MTGVQPFWTEHAHDKRTELPHRPADTAAARTWKLRGVRAVQTDALYFDCERVRHYRQEFDLIVRKLVCQPPVERVTVLRLTDHHEHRLGHRLRWHDGKVDAQRNLRQRRADARSVLGKIVPSRDHPEGILRHRARRDLQARKLVPRYELAPILPDDLGGHRYISALGKIEPRGRQSDPAQDPVDQREDGLRRRR